MPERKRCAWASHPLLAEYHDQEWGVPEHDDRRLFEFLILEGAQAGLSWITVLRKRENYRKAMDGFDPEKIARYDDAKIAALLQDSGLQPARATPGGPEVEHDDLPPQCGEHQWLSLEGGELEIGRRVARPPVHGLEVTLGRGGDGRLT